VFILPFILKWVVAALVVSVLVNLFSSLRKQGDHSHSSVVAQIQALVIEWWQRLFQHAPSNLNVLGTFSRLNFRGRRFRALATSVRSASEKKRKDYAFRRQCNEKPSITPGCPGVTFR